MPLYFSRDCRVSEAANRVSRRPDPAYGGRSATIKLPDAGREAPQFSYRVSYCALSLATAAVRSCPTYTRTVDRIRTRALGDPSDPKARMVPLYHGGLFTVFLYCVPPSYYVPPFLQS
ncbi:hypothetical protein E2C01_042976 [Portunus trituberculatus]|uniref:Uncharacterized protein n=1 Tax=Portunus trituberculatus TaxID=210409 RepID=A0A5B7FP01_PORTR|nr:hypothetical protein [Portunus trituberculatus]